MTTRLLIAILVLSWKSSLIASPESDLASPSQEVRDAAAKILRASYTPPSSTNWDSVVNAIREGMPRTNVLELLSPFKVTTQHGPGGGGSFSEAYRLDDAWILVCWFRMKDDTLIDRKLSASLRAVEAQPLTTNFSGVWITYYVNGQKAYETHLADGKRDGEDINYYPNGSKNLVVHYINNVAEGPETSYFASGHTNYQGEFRAGKRVGTLTWYNEDGSVKSTEDYSK